MRLRNGIRHKTKTYPSGKRIRLTMTREGRVLRTSKPKNRTLGTKTGRHLNKIRRRIGL